MRVVCIKLVEPLSGNLQSESDWLTLDGEYVVLSIYGSRKHGIELRVVDDLMQKYESGPVLWPAEMFMTVSTDIPSSWVASIGDDGLFEIGPAKWMRPGFWQDYLYGEAAAVADFEEEKTRILEEAQTGSTSDRPH